MRSRTATLLLNDPLILFLGHDEVLHGSSDGFFYAGVRFAGYMDRLTWLLSRHPPVGVVLSRDWVEEVNTKELALILPLSFRARILGLLPDGSHGKKSLNFVSAIQDYAVARRARGWIALTDDTAAWPTELKKHLVDVRGTRSLLDPAIEKRLGKRLAWLVSRGSNRSTKRSKGGS